MSLHLGETLKLQRKKKISWVGEGRMKTPAENGLPNARIRSLQSKEWRTKKEDGVLRAGGTDELTGKNYSKKKKGKVRNETEQRDGSTQLNKSRRIPEHLEGRVGTETGGLLRPGEDQKKTTTGGKKKRRKK